MKDALCEGVGVAIVKADLDIVQYTHLMEQADILTYLSIEHLGLPKDKLPEEIVEDAYQVDKELANRVFERMFEEIPPASDTNVWRERWKLFKGVLRDGWKYRGLYGMSPARFMMYKIYGVVFGIGEE